MSTMKTKAHSKPSMDKNNRRRGRPAGKNRVPLSLEERRARNAQYERERRTETAEAMAQLAEAACCDPQITNPELLATVINRLQNVENGKALESIEDLKRINDNLESQIAALESRLESDSGLKEENLNSSEGSTSSQSDSDSGSEFSGDQRPTKYSKKSIENTVHSVAEQFRRSSSREAESSLDSNDSIWSHHQFGKTMPSQQVLLQSTSDQNEQLDFDSTSSPHPPRTESVSSESRQATSSENEIYSESSNQSETNSKHTSTQQNVKVEFQLVPELDRMKSETSVKDQSEMSFMDPFTEREKRILERLGCSDFINFDDQYDGNEARLIWPLDFDDCLAGY